MSFELDPFQKESIAHIQNGVSVLVSAPTGSGKTLIAESAIDQAFQAGQSVIYTAPIKALSNQKYRDFRARYGDEPVGILTGDVSINPDARVLIMTTEIYRNSLFESASRVDKIGWVIFDEIHYLDDVERGTVWEEALLFTPPHVKILALSATAPNIEELANWIASIQDRKIVTVTETKRPVPLDFHYQCQGQFMWKLKELRKKGYLGRDSWRVSWREKRRGMRPLRAKPNRLDQLLKELKTKSELPLIYFAFGRRRTETLAREAVHFDFLENEERKKITETYQSLLEQYDLTREASAHDLGELISRGIAFHHAGMLPTLKEVVEQLFTSRLIKVIFTTETFALGINMPARSVAFDELEKYYGTGFKHLTTRDFYQMAGRAGRRGMDERGFVYVRVNPSYTPFNEVERIIFGKPEKIRSQFNTTYATLLNLYRKLGSKLIDIYPRTFHNFQSSDKRRRGAVAHMERKLALLRELGHLDGDQLTGKGEFAASLFGYELLLAEMQDDGVLDDLNESKLSVVLSSLIYEPRKGDKPPNLRGDHLHLQNGINYYSKRIHKKERKFQIYPYTKPSHFNLARTVQLWTEGAGFDELFRHTGVDEGELVRHFRMIIQLLRDLMNVPHASDRLHETAHKAWKSINRGVVDAEKQLRVEAEKKASS
jgi:superfamily II RNA helicase